MKFNSRVFPGLCGWSTSNFTRDRQCRSTAGEKLTLLILPAAISGVLADPCEKLTLLMLPAAIGGVLADSVENLTLLMLSAAAATLSYIAIPLATSNISTVYEPVCNVLNRE